MEKERGIIITNVDEQKQCDINVVVKSFYCFYDKNKKVGKCGNQCITCKSMKLMQ